jgi:hypothetical protein
MAITQGNLIAATSDAHLTALDAKTGLGAIPRRSERAPAARRAVPR